jgi:uracil-DNA glycosylase
VIYSPAPPLRHSTGSATPRIVILGEAWGREENYQQKPFVGASGKELFRMLFEVFPEIAPETASRALELMRLYESYSWLSPRDEWLQAAGIALTNVFAFQPQNNKLDTLCLSKKELPPGYELPALSRGKYLDPRYEPELERLEAELLALNPNLVLACGATASWALLRATAIGTIRGAITEGKLGSWTGKVLPTFHPANVLYLWSQRPIVLADLLKAGIESEFPEIRRINRRILVNPTIEEVIRWTDETLAKPPAFLSIDIETMFKQIDMVGFARGIDDALVIPFINKSKRGLSYWDSIGDEMQAWGCVQRLCESPIPKVFQNGLYDLQYLLKNPMKVARCEEDSMLLHHSLFPEMKKGLGFLASIYVNEPAWKTWRHEKPDTEKKDE